MITPIKTWLHDHPKAKQWLWFAGLWLGGLGAVSSITYPIKWMIKLAS
ncbi:MAG: DUF2474 domain-containing protein [Alphaproteobacteria bacterium]|nr:DUF2474 domain-containing protein [Alphaproteobacteria bacterium]